MKQDTTRHERPLTVGPSLARELTRVNSPLDRVRYYSLGITRYKRTVLEAPGTAKGGSRLGGRGYVKKLGALALLVLVIVGNMLAPWQVNGVAAASAGFSDVSASHPAYAAITRLAALGVIRGYADGRFGPDDPIVRAQMAALIARAMGWDAETWVNPFPDRGGVDVNLWRNVGTLSHYNVAQGYPDGLYRPTHDVFYAQTISFITRAMVAKRYWTMRSDNPAIYPDVPASSGHRADLSTFVAYAGLVPGTSSTSQSWPVWNQPATRAWFAQAQWQALERHFARQLPAKSDYDQEERLFFIMINQYRAQNRVGPLAVSPRLSNAAQWMSGDMASKNYFSHTDSRGRDPFTRMCAFDYCYSTAKAENIAAGDGTGVGVFLQWRNSTGHNANMLSALYTAIGVGRAAGGRYGWYWTTDFGGYRD